MVGPQGVHDEKKNIMNLGDSAPHLEFHIPVLFEPEDPFLGHGKRSRLGREKRLEGLAVEFENSLDLGIGRQD